MTVPSRGATLFSDATSGQLATKRCPGISDPGKIRCDERSSWRGLGATLSTPGTRKTGRCCEQHREPFGGNDHAHRIAWRMRWPVQKLRSRTFRWCARGSI